MKKKTKKPFKFFWNKENRINTTEVLINGKLFTCIILSVVSAFIDIVFFSGLSKSDYPFFNLGIPAAIILSIMSIGFSGGKFFVAMQLAAIKEIETRLKELSYSVKKFFWLKLKWNLVHKFLISISIVTSISLSVITIGNGVRQMEQNIKNQTTDAQYLIDLKDSIKSGNKEKREATKSNITGSITARDTAKEEVETYWKYIEEYREKRNKIEDDENLTKEEKEKQIKEIRTKAVNRVPKLTSKNIEFISKSEFEALMRNIAENNEIVDNSKLYDEVIAYDEEELKQFIIALQDKDYRTPDGAVIQFVENGEPINRELAISRLQHSIMLWQSDTGDAGASSKVFTLVATYLKANETAGGLGVSEIIMMTLIMIFGIVQEFLIAIFTPRATINRKMLSQFSEYLDNVDLNKFMLYTYKNYLDRGILSTEEFDVKSKKAVELMENGIEDIIAKYTKKKNKEEYSNKVDNLVKEIEGII